MTNPFPANPTGIDIRASADRVIGHLRQGQYVEAIRVLEDTRSNQRLVVQEALDRYVASGAASEIDRLGSTGLLAIDDLPVLQRLQAATGAPRLPAHGRAPGEANEFVGLTNAQTYDVYASMAETRGTQAAKDALRLDRHSVLLGLRRENPIWASDDGLGRAGTGVYDDRIVVLMRVSDRERSVFVADRASTEPTAQYSHHAGSNGRRPFSGAGAGDEMRVLAASPGYEGVTRPRKIEGEDVNGDTMRDLGRLAEGTVEMSVARHSNPALARTNDAFRPSDAYLGSGQGIGGIQRDTNADGYFTSADEHGTQDLNSTFKIHSGSRWNTDSAGCQTIHPEDYQDFISAARLNPEQTRWQYVLTSTQGGLFHNVEVGREAAPVETTLAPADRQDERQSNGRPGEGPFEDPGLNRYYAAVLAGNSDEANRIALGFAFRAPEPVLHGAIAMPERGMASAGSVTQAHQHGASILQP